MAHTPWPRGSSGAAQDRMLGRVLGTRYRVLSRLGEGGMGTVYLCEHAVLGRRYAVKVLRPELGGDPELAARFRNEAIAASRIGGGHVVDVLDFGAETDGALYYVMEALEGRSLGALVVDEGPLAIPRALDLLQQLCAALGAAHARGVVHRDVKPDNVFVVRAADGGEQVKVIDFGISQVAPEAGQGRLTLVGEIIGTPEYMAPEQATGDPVDHRADVYALGVLAYELLTATLPIVAHTPVATLVAHQTRTPEPPSRRRGAVPPAVDALVLRALAKRPEDRFPTMEAFGAAIAEIRGVPFEVTRERTLVRPGPVPSTPAASPPQPRSAGRWRSGDKRVETVALPGKPRPRRGLRVGIAVAAIAAAIAGAAAWWGRGGAGRGAFSGAAPTATPTATPTPTPTPTPAPAPAPAPTATPTAAPTPTATPTAAATQTPTSTSTSGPTGAPAAAKRASRTRSVRAPSPPREDDAHLEDPYGPGALKDPYR